MWIPRSPIHLAFPMLLALGLPGCALYPVMDGPEKFQPATETEIPCNTHDYSKAMQCAVRLNGELSKLTKGVHDYNLFSSYTAWFLGSVTGGVLAFDGGEDVLKGLALGAGSLVGLNAVVKPEEQRKIVSAAQTDLDCIVSVASSVHDAQGSAALLAVAGESQAAIQGITDARMNAMSPILAAAKSGTPADAQAYFTYFKSQEQDQQFMVMAKTAREVSQSVVSETDIGGKLSKAVLDLRERVRQQLTKNSTIDEGTAKKQRDLIVGMAGEIVKKRADLKRQKDAASATGDQAHELALQAAETAAKETANIDGSLSGCVDPATLEVLKS